MVVVGAHFIPRSFNLDRFILYCVKVSPRPAFDQARDSQASMFLLALA
jgi:hypothetical protein